MLPEEEIREKYLQFKKDCPSGFLSRLHLIQMSVLTGRITDLSSFADPNSWISLAEEWAPRQKKSSMGYLRCWGVPPTLHEECITWYCQVMD